MQVLISISKSRPGAMEKMVELQAYFDSLNILHECIDVDQLIWSDPACTDAVPQSVRDGIIDLVVTLGGDGTILRTARLVKDADIPILGINLGTLGFLANDVEGDILDIVKSALAGEMIEEKRTNLLCDIVCQGESDWIEGEGEKMRSSLFALNDVAITRGDTGVTLDMYLDISSGRIGRFKGDGMIIASATGSTAYSLAAGGPIVAPSFHGLIVQPLASHTISARTVLTNENDLVRLSFSHTEHEPVDRRANVYIDGMKAILPSKPSTIYVRRGMIPTRLLYLHANTTLSKATQTFFRGL